MKFRSMFAILAGLALVSGCNKVPQNDPDPRIWNFPSFDSTAVSKYNGSWEFTIHKVELTDDQTIITLNVNGYPSYSYTFARQTFLKADNGENYELISIDGLEPGQFKPMNETRNDLITFHFKPMPVSVKSFDLIESYSISGAFNIYGIHKHDYNSTAIIGTHWENLRTGDWVISFMEDHVIYDCRYWSYQSKPADNSSEAQDITISCDGQTATVHIGALKHGRRTINIQAPNGTKQFSCASFDSRNLPEYPNVARRANMLLDYGYQSVDTVTMRGLLIGPDWKNQSFTVDVQDVLIGQIPKYTFSTDDNGFFTVRFPITNTTTAMIRKNGLGGCFSMPVEPGRTYFVYTDAFKDRTYVMGEKSRIQNEYQAYNNYIHVNIKRTDEMGLESDLDAYLEYAAGCRDAHELLLDSLKKVHPSLSDGLLDYSRAVSNINLYQMLGQARFATPQFKIPQNMVDFIQQDMKSNSIKPYSLTYDFNYFLRDFTQHLSSEYSYTITGSLSEMIEYGFDRGLIECSDEDKAALLMLADFNDKIGELNRKYDNNQDSVSKAVLEIMTPDTEEQLKRASELFNSLNISPISEELSRNKVFNKEFGNILAALDTLDFEQSFKDMVLTHFMTEQMTGNRHSVPAAAVALFDSIVTYRPCQNAVHECNDRYLALESVDLASLGNDVSVQELEELSTGKAILSKITEPYRGKIIYIDVWGSWCHPCMENLEHAHELKKALKDYDIVYLYLASGTTESAWKGVIKEYNLTGPDCVHYNLPDKQQTLVERFLEVDGYPTYRLMNRNGALLPGSYSPHHLSKLIETLKKL